ncbi:MAG: glycosyltransferase [Bacteroidia bacterium]|nr:glycosyltransferase [Bacteroidia bacterium]
MISVCIATHNGEKFIRSQIESVLLQLSTDDEVIVSDDGSSDNTIDIIQKIGDKRIKIYEYKQDATLLQMTKSTFRLCAANFQKALSRAQGDYIFLADQDDLWSKDRVQQVMEAFQREDCDMVLCNYRIIDQNGNDTDILGHTKNPIRKNLLLNLCNIPFMGCCIAIKKDVLKYCLPFPYACISHDNWIGCLVGYFGKIVYLQDPLHLYRRHFDNVSPTTQKSENNYWFRINYRIVLLWQMLNRILKMKE